MNNVKRVINFILPVTACNFKCHYCYIGQEDRFSGELGKLDYTPKWIAEAMTTERLGGVCHVNMCGLGETLLAPYAVDLAQLMLLNGHYVSVVTNGSVSKRIKELCDLPEDFKKRLFIKFSFHFLELQRLNLMDLFFDNVRLARDSGCSFSVELTVNDESVGSIPEIQDICRRELGALCHVIESRNNLDGFSRLTELPVEEHQKAWKRFESPLFNFQQTQWMVKRREFCYAGDWIVSLNVGSGWLMPCFAGGNAIQNIFEDPNEPIRFVAIGKNCPWTHCYAAYVLLTSGVVPSLQTPNYAQFRNRRGTDGSNWLKPEVKGFFESKLQESNKEYSIDKKTFINGLMSLEYGNNESLQEPHLISKILEKHLLGKNIYSVGLWGKSSHAKWLYSLLITTSINVSYIIDSEYYDSSAPTLKEKIKRQVKYKLKSFIQKKENPLLLNRYDRMPRVDALIISDYTHFEIIKKQLKGKMYRDLLSITQLAD